jgi:pilus assembly protein CpaF
MAETTTESPRISDALRAYYDELGPIQPFLYDDSVTEIMVNGPHSIYVERGGRLHPTEAQFDDEMDLLRVIHFIVSSVGRRIDNETPMVDARLADGSRVNAVIPPLALDGPLLTIRKFAREPLRVQDLIGFGTLSAEAAGFLEACVLARCNMLVSGGTGTGKTTLLNVLSGFIPNDERIVTIEDAAELQLKQDHVCRMESRPANINGEGRVAIRELVINSLRMRPDRIVVGECRGAEALDMLQALNTGHDGSLTTLHANSPRDGLARLETLVLMAGVDLPTRAIRQQIASAINVIVQLSRLRDGSRKITQVSELVGMEGDTISMQDIFVFEPQGQSPEGKVVGTFKPTGIRPRILDQLFAFGVPLPEEIVRLFPGPRPTPGALHR